MYIPFLWARVVGRYNKCEHGTQRIWIIIITICQPLEIISNITHLDCHKLQTTHTNIHKCVTFNCLEENDSVAKNQKVSFTIPISDCNKMHIWCNSFYWHSTLFFIWKCLANISYHWIYVPSLRDTSTS